MHWRRRLLRPAFEAFKLGVMSASKDGVPTVQKCSKCGYIWDAELAPGWMLAEYEVKDHASDAECKVAKTARREKQTVR